MSHGGVHGGASPRPSCLAVVSPLAHICISEASLCPLCPGHRGPSSLAQGALFSLRFFLLFSVGIFSGKLTLQMLNFLD